MKEGAPTRVGAVEIQGMEGLPPEDREAALEKMPVAVGKTFVEADWAAAKEGLRTRLRNRGYARATVAGVALVDAATQTATLRMAVAPGRRYQFGEVQVATDPGNRIPASPIWEQARVAVPEGRVYSDEAIEAARERLVAMGVFSSVVVRAGTPDEAAGRIPVVVRVHEAPFHTLRLGAGVRVDPVRNEVRGISEWTHRDFLGGLRRLTARAEAGWAFMPSLIAVPNANQSQEPRRDGPIGRLALELQQPRFLGRPTLTERTILVGDHSLEQTYTSTGASITTGVLWQPWMRLAFAFSYTLETDYLTGPPVSGAATAPLTLGCQTTTNQCWVWLSYLSETVTWDRRDNRLEPRNGTYLALGLQEGGGPLGGNFEYLRVLPEARGYVSFGDDQELTLSGRLRVGELYPRSGRAEDSAVSTRFYCGRREFDARVCRPAALAAAASAGPLEPRPVHYLADWRQRARRRERRGAVFADGQSPSGSLSRFRSGDPRARGHGCDVADAVGGGARRALSDTGGSDTPRSRDPASLRGPAPALRRRRHGRHRASAFLSHQQQLLWPVRIASDHAGTGRFMRRSHFRGRSVLARVLRVLGAVALTAIAVLALAVGGAWALLQSRWGSDVVRRYAVKQINGGIAGKVRVDRLALSGMHLTLAGVEVRDPQGHPALTLERAEISVSLPALLRGHVKMTSVALVRPHVFLIQRPDGLGIGRAFHGRGVPIPPPTEPASKPRTIEIDNLALSGAMVEYRDDLRHLHARLDDLNAAGTLRMADVLALSANITGPGLDLSGQWKLDLGPGKSGSDLHARLEAAPAGARVSAQASVGPERIDLAATVEASDLAATGDAIAKIIGKKLDLVGRGRLKVTMAGPLDALALKMTAEAPSLGVENVRVRDLRARAFIPDLGAPDALDLEVTAASGRVGDRSLISPAVSLQSVGTRLSAHVRVRELAQHSPSRNSRSRAPQSIDLGAIDLSLAGRRERGLAPALAMTVDRLDLSYPGGRWTMSHPARVRVGGDELVVSGLALANGAQRVELNVDRKPQGLAGRVAVTALDLAQLAPLLGPTAPAVGGRLNADVRLEPQGRSPIVHATANLAGGRVGRLRGLELSVDGHATGGRARGRLTAKAVGVDAEASVRFPARWPPRKRPNGAGRGSGPHGHRSRGVRSSRRCRVGRAVASVARWASTARAPRRDGGGAAPGPRCRRPQSRRCQPDARRPGARGTRRRQRAYRPAPHR